MSVNTALESHKALPEQEVILDVAYERTPKKKFALLTTLGLAVGYWIGGITPLHTAVNLLAFPFFLNSVCCIGHARLLTSRLIIDTLGSDITHRQRSKSFSALSSDPNKNSRMQVVITATPFEIAKLESIESGKSGFSITCSHGAARLLAEAGLPHAPFPISLSPTLSVIHLLKQLKTDRSIKIKYLNLTENQSKIDMKIAAAAEVSLFFFFMFLFGLIVFS